MTLYPCPRCGRVPSCEHRRTPAGAQWSLECQCFEITSFDKYRLELEWTLYCLREAER